MALSPLFIVLGGALLSYLVYSRVTLYIARRRFIKQNGCKPCPYRFNKDPILGLDMLRAQSKAVKSHTMLAVGQKRFHDMGTKTFHNRIVNLPVIMTCEPENVKTILSLKFKDYSFGARKTAFTPLLGNGIFNADGEHWTNSRHLLRPNFAREQIADLNAFERHFKFMLKHIPRDGSTVDLQDLFFKYSMDSATGFLFNHSTDTLRSLEVDESNPDYVFSKAMNAATKDAMNRVRFGPLNRFRDNSEGNEAIRLVHEYVDTWVDTALKFRKEKDEEIKAGVEKEDERYVFIHELARATKDKKRIRDELTNILLAGRDTTASLLANMFFEIAKQPEVYAKLRAEVATLEGKTPSYEQLRNLKYLKWCLNESLRIHPVVPGNSRFAVRDTVLPLGGGPDGTHPLFVPKGTLVAYHVYSMHRRTDIYGPDADLYRPERWENLRTGWEYLPFNGGPRICLGQQYALTEAGYVTVRLVQEFREMEARDPGPWEEGLSLTVCSLNGTKVGLTPDTSATDGVDAA